MFCNSSKVLPFGLNFACQRVSDVTALIYPGTAADLVGLRVALLDRGVEVGVRPNHDIEDVAAADAVAVSAFALLQTLVVLGKYRRLAHFFNQVGCDGVNGNAAVEVGIGCGVGICVNNGFGSGFDG